MKYKVEGAGGGVGGGSIRVELVGWKFYLRSKGYFLWDYVRGS